MKNLKNGFSNRIIIYQMTLLDRVVGMWSALMFTALPIVGLLLGFENKIGIIILLFAMVVYCIFMWFSVFKTYICLDVKNSKLIIRETPGLKKEELSLDAVTDIKISDGVNTKKLFTIDINMGGYVKQIKSWSTPPDSRISMFGGYKRQTKRLEKFCIKCNEYLKTKSEGY